MLIQMGRNAKPILAGVLTIAMVAGLGVSLTGLFTGPKTATPTASPSASPQPTKPTQPDADAAQIIAEAAQASLGQPYIFQSCLAPKNGETPESGSDVYVETDAETGGMWYADNTDKKITTQAGYPTGEGSWLGLTTEAEWIGAIQTAKVTDLNAPTERERAQILKAAGVPDATWVQFPEDGSVVYGTKPTAEYGYLMRGMQILSGAYQGVVGAQQPAPSPQPGQPTPTPTPTPLSTTETLVAEDGVRTITVTPAAGDPTVVTVNKDGLVSQVAITGGQACDFTYAKGDPKALMKPPAGPSVAWASLEKAITAWGEKVRKAGGNASPVAQTTVTLPPDPNQSASGSPAGSQPAENGEPQPTGGPSAR